MFFLRWWALYRVSACLSSGEPGAPGLPVPSHTHRQPGWPFLAVICLVLGGLCGGFSPETAYAVPAFPPFGPLRLVNQQPLQVLFLQPLPDLATPVAAHQAMLYVNLALTNTLVQDTQEDISAVMDLEMVRAVVDLRYGVWSRLEAGGINWAIIPTVILQGGVTEDALRSGCCASDVSFFLNLATHL